MFPPLKRMRGDKMLWIYNCNHTGSVELERPELELDDCYEYRLD